MPAMYDCYVLSPDRSPQFVISFLDEFLSARKPIWDPSDPVDVLGLSDGHSLVDILDFLEQHSQVSYSMYFRNLEEQSPHFAILAYCGDGSLILGLTANDDEANAKATLTQLESFTGSDGYYWMESPPPSGKQEFFRLRRDCRQSPLQ